MKIQKELISKINASFEAYTTECGCLLGIKDSVICKILFDCGTNNVAEYAPDISLFNKCLKMWAREEIEFAGIMHSHPNDCRFLSYEDEKAIKEISRAIECDHALYFPIFTICKGESVITVYKYENDIIERDKIEII